MRLEKLPFVVVLLVGGRLLVELWLRDFVLGVK